MPTNVKNSFKDLQDEESAKFSEQSEQKIRHSLESNVGLFHFIGEIVELYLPKIFGMFVKMSGGAPSPTEDFNNPNRASDNDRPKYPNTLD